MSAYPSVFYDHQKQLPLGYETKIRSNQGRRVRNGCIWPGKTMSSC